MALRYRIPLFLVLTSILIVSCTDLATLRSSQPIAPVRDYEVLLVGNLEANYVGDENCLASCHTHDKINIDFKHSVHGDQISEGTGLPLVTVNRVTAREVRLSSMPQSIPPMMPADLCRLPNSRLRPNRCSVLNAIRQHPPQI